MLKRRGAVYVARDTALWKSQFFFVFFYNCIVPLGFLPQEIRVAFPGESQLRHSRATQPVVNVGCLSVSIIHPTLAWTSGSLTCVQMLTCEVAHGSVRTPQESVQRKLTPGEKSFTAPGIRTCLSGVPVLRSTN